MTLAIGMLLSPQARIIHERNRLMISKRIVEYEGTHYVLHRFRRHSTFERFMRLIGQVAETGASIQRVAARTITSEQQRQHGYWIALDYVPGSILGPEPAPRSMMSLGRSLARLHSVEGPEGEALFAARHPKLPHAAYLLATAGLSAEERTWIRSSRDQLRKVRASQLTHGDLYAANIIETPDLSVSLIDYELMVFEQAGIELAIALLRPFCRRSADRRLLVETYLEHCTEPNAEAWRQHGHNFLFAAAARLSLRRRYKRLRLATTGALLHVRASIGAGRNLRASIETNEKRMRISERHRVYFEHVARAVMQHQLSGAAESPLELLDRVNAEFFGKA